MSSNITLTAGIRQNLLSLQQTSSDLTTTQEALATGKSVNSAADNPSAYFTSQNLTNTANSLNALLDQIGQGSQTIDAATNGLTGLTSLLQQALSTVQQAQSDSWTRAGSATGTVNLGSATAAAGNLLISVGSTTYTVAVTPGRFWACRSCRGDRATCAPARWATDVSTEITRSRLSMSAAVSAKSCEWYPQALARRARSKAWR
jgi:flagellin-like hook-associated protein FlgL